MVTIVTIWFHMTPARVNRREAHRLGKGLVRACIVAEVQQSVAELEPPPRVVRRFADPGAHVFRVQRIAGPRRVAGAVGVGRS